MSDVERQSGRDGEERRREADHAGSPHALPARNMSDIARLFLEGARPLHASRPVAPRRTPPAAPPPPPAPVQSKPVDPRPEPLPARPAAAPAHTAVLGIAHGTHEAASWRLLVQAAKGLAEEQSTTVAIVGLLAHGGRHACVVDVVGIESREELPPMRNPEDDPSTGSDLQIARAIHGMRPAVGLWIVASPRPDSRTFPAVGSIVAEWLLVCPTDNDGLVAGYQFLKNCWTRAEAGRNGNGARILPAVYLLSEDYAQAAVVHRRLRKASQDFLKTDLALAGAGPARAEHDAIRVLSLACTGPEEALWAAILDELCPPPPEEAEDVPAASPLRPAEQAVRQVAAPSAAQDIEDVLEKIAGHSEELARQSAAASAMALDHLAQVLDPDERAALNAGFEEPGVAVALPRAEPRTDAPAAPADETPEPVVLTSAPPEAPAALPQAAPEPAPAAIAPEAAPAAPETSDGSLRAFDVPGQMDRQSQWQAVERSIWDLSPRSALLEARPPMSWAAETCISIDSSGRLNVWTLYKDGASWFALREWAQEHRNLLALTRRDLPIRRDVEVAVHIVLPLDDADADKSGSIVAMLMRTPSKNVHIYRLRTVQWNARRGILVVPIA